MLYISKVYVISFIYMEVIMLTLWNPFLPEKSVADSKISAKNYFDRLFEHNFSSMFDDLFTRNYGIEYIKGENNTLEISVEVPGVQEPDLSIEITNNIINIKGERKTSKSSYLISKSLSVPEGYDSDNVKAELKNGILTIVLASKNIEPIKEAKKIPISSK